MPRPRRPVASLLLLTTVLVTTAVPAVARAQGDSTRVRRWRQDLEFLVTKLREIHPRPFAYVSAARFDSAVAALDARLPRLTDAEAAIELMRVAALPADGHTMVFPTPAIGFRTVHPVRLYPFDDGLRFLAVPAGQERFLGARVARYGEVDAATALERAAAITAGDNPRSREIRATLFLMMPAALHALGITADATRLRIEAELVSGGRAALEVTPVAMEGMPHWFLGGGYGLPVEKHRTLFDLAPLPLHMRSPERAWWFEHIPERRLIYFQFRRVEPFDAGQTFARFVERMFAFADSAKAERMVIDLRHNSGGNNLILQPLIHGLIRRDVLNRRGHLFTIIGRETFSAAMNCANWIEEHTRTLFIGEPTGGRPNHYGDARQLELPNSKAMLMISTVPWQARLPWDDRVWIAPQIAAPPDAGAWRAGRDPALEAVFEYLDGGTLAERIERAAGSGPPAVARAIAAYRERFPDRWGASSEAELLEIGRDLAERRRHDLAIVVLEACVTAYPRSVGAHVRLGEALLESGRPEQALEWCRKALALSPQSRSAKVLMERITAAR